MQATTEYNYLKFTSLEKTVFWDFYTLINNKAINSTFPITKLSEVLNQRKGFITIDDSILYKRCRVQIQGKGVVLRDEVLGKEIKTKKQQLCKTDDFLVAEIDAKVGGFGIVPQELENAIVSSHYFLFEINKNLLLPEFLSIVVKQEGFLKQVKSTGSTNYAAIRPYHVLEYKIPLPTIVEQKKLVNEYYQKTKESEILSKKASDLEGEIEKYLSDELGIENIKNKKNKGLNFINLSEITRWDIWNKSTQFNNSDNRIVQLRDIIKMKSGNFLPASKMEKGDYYVYGGNGKNGDHNSYTYEGKRIVIGRVGEYCGNVHLVDGKYWITDNAFVVDKISDEVSYEFLSIVLKQLNLNNYRVLSAQPSISQSIILNLEMPLPSKETQNRLVEKVAKEKDAITNFSRLSISIKEEAENQFEKAIFNN